MSFTIHVAGERRTIIVRRVAPSFVASTGPAASYFRNL